MLDDLLEAATYLDWISPMLAIGKNIANGPSHTFLIPTGCGWRGGDIAKTLRNQGIKTWGHMIVRGHFMITVKQAEAQRAQALLASAGLPGGGRRPKAQRGQPRRGRSKLWGLLP